MKRFIIYFDVWTKGSHHYSDLKKLFEKDNIELILIHFGSYGEDISDELIREVNGITTYDIKYFNNDINKAILEFKPLAILFLSLDPLIMRTCNLFAIKNKIKSFLTYPGLWSAQDYDKQRLLSYRGFIRYAKWVYSRMFNYVLNSLPQYIKALKVSNYKLRIIKSFIKDEFNKLFGILSPRSSLDRYVNTVFIFNEFDKVHAQKKFKDSKFKIIGVPDLYRFGKIEKLNYFKIQSNEFLYLGSGSRSRGMFYSNFDDYFEYLYKVKMYFNRFGKKIYFKLHHSTKEKIEYLNSKRGKKLEFINNNEFLGKLSNLEGCIVEPSSISLIPIYTGIKLFGTRMFDLKEINFGDSIKNYALFSYLNEEDDLNRELYKLNKISQYKVNNSIKKICGEDTNLSPSIKNYQGIKDELNITNV